MSELGTTGVVLDPDDPDNQDPSNQDPNHIASLRKKAKDFDKVSTDNLDLKKQLLFFKVGIDPAKTKVGQMLYDTWKGGVDDVDALKAEALELKLIEADTAPAPAGAGNQPGEQQQQQQPAQPGQQGGAGMQPVPARAAEDAQRGQLQQILSGGSPSGAQAPETQHPAHRALEKYHRDVSQGMDVKLAREHAFASMIDAANKGDARVFFNRDQHMRDAMEADRVAGRPNLAP